MTTEPDITAIRRQLVNQANEALAQRTPFFHAMNTAAGLSGPQVRIEDIPGAASWAYEGLVCAGTYMHSVAHILGSLEQDQPELALKLARFLEVVMDAGMEALEGANEDLAENAGTEQPKTYKPAMTGQGLLPGTETARLTGDAVIFGTNSDGQVGVLLVKRRWKPFADHWALPGGHLDMYEDTEHATRRELGEEAGIEVAELAYVATYAQPGRDPRGRYVTFAYTASLDGQPTPTARDDAAEAAWFPMPDALHDLPLAFDHRKIIADAYAVHRAAAGA